MSNLLSVKHLVLSTAAAALIASIFALPAYAAQRIQPITTRSGQYSYAGYTLKYSVRVLKKGGPITGQFSGVCTGPITGRFAGGEGGKVEGTARANCKIAFIHYNLTANYKGKLYLNTGKVDLDWEGKIPYTPNKGSFTVYFDPVK